ncbi:FadR/GntR family transcriptional regulator [Devosia aurantiaca]|nr:FadR/GntR family transcriptional regulator [Devosia aurantiaca]
MRTQMRALIEDGSWSPRSRLPSETELARRFGMSRPVIRQALARLRDDGLIQSRQGSGSFVLEPIDGRDVAPSQVAFPAISSFADITAFASFREGMEGEIAAAAALNRTEAQLGAIASVLARLDDKKPLSDRPQDDFDFHLAVAAATGNPFFINSLSSLREHMMMGMSLIWNFSADSADFRSTVGKHHRAVYAAIAKRDDGAARAAMKEHLQWASARMFKG